MIESSMESVWSTIKIKNEKEKERRKEKKRHTLTHKKERKECNAEDYLYTILIILDRIQRKTFATFNKIRERTKIRSIEIMIFIPAIHNTTSLPQLLISSLLVSLDSLKHISFSSCLSLPVDFLL